MIRRFLEKSIEKCGAKNSETDKTKNVIIDKNNMNDLVLYDMIYDKDYEIISELSSGVNSVIYLLKDKTTKTLKIMKIYKKRKDSILNYLSSNIHTQMEHPNIIKIYDYVETKKYIMILMEYIDNDLFNIINELHENLIYISEFRASIYVEQIVKGLKYCKEKFGIMHRDVKTENILIDIDDNVKIIDFEFATTNPHPTEICGTVDFMAPELLKNSGEPYDYKIDIWSLGVLVYEMIYHDMPFPTNIENISQLIKLKPMNYKIQFPEYPTRSDIIKDFIKQLLKVNPLERLDYDKILEHPFIAKREKEIIREKLKY